jgi:hypothetical protein
VVLVPISAAMTTLLVEKITSFARQALAAIQKEGCTLPGMYGLNCDGTGSEIRSQDATLLFRKIWDTAAKIRFHDDGLIAAGPFTYVCNLHVLSMLPKGSQNPNP